MAAKAAPEHDRGGSGGRALIYAVVIVAPVPTSARSPARADVEVGEVGGPPRVTLAAGIVALALVGAALVTVGPTAAILVCLLLVVLALCVWAPAYAFALSLALYSFEGTVKMRLSVEGAPSPVAMGAAALDFAFLASLVALLLSDGG